MSARTLLALLAVATGGPLTLIAADGGGVRTNITTATTGISPKTGGSPMMVLPQSNQVWSALVLATNVPDPKPAPRELREFASRMKKVFGYNQFELAGSATQAIGAGDENWLVPSKSFWMGLKGRRALSKEAQGGFLLSLQLYQDTRELVDTEVKLAPGSPLFIRGPQYGNGQLIIILQVQR